MTKTSEKLVKSGKKLVKSKNLVKDGKDAGNDVVFSSVGIGRPPEYSSPKKLQKRIDEYLQKGCKTKVVNIKGESIIVPNPTITGLCYFLGFASRQSFYDYEEKELFTYTIKRARLFMESVYEGLLTSGNVTGAIFALKNFGWKDAVEQTVNGGALSASNVTIYLPDNNRTENDN